VLKAALNGDRKPGCHPALPIDADQLAADSVSCVRAGADAIHLHVRGRDGLETLDPEVVNKVVRRVRASVSVPVGVSTGSWIEPDPDRRAEAVSLWTEPDMASVNMSEDGAIAVMKALRSAGVGIEAGVWSEDDARRLSASGFADQLIRVLVEIRQPVPDPTAEARVIDAALDRFGITAPRLHHGEEAATWPVLVQARALGRDLRIGLEDTLVLPDGTTAASNEELVRFALAL
jgi:uncharacterized protein (DUF849 family)